MRHREYAQNSCSRICISGQTTDWAEKGERGSFPVQNHVRASGPSMATRHYTAYLFMCRWTCSRCWRMVMKLGALDTWLKSQKIRIVMVGQGGYLSPAKKFARELRVPFRLIADEHQIFRNIFGLHQQNIHYHHLPMILANDVGKVCYWSRLPVESKHQFIDELTAAIQGFEDC